MKTLKPEIAPNLAASHGFFTAQGGVSGGVFQTLNMGVGSGDAQGDILENRKRVARFFNVAEKHILHPYQIHSNKCEIVSKTFDLENRPKCDALVTDQKNIVIGVLTADCAPILFEGYKVNGDKVIGAAHAGWKGAFDGVTKSTLDQMGALGVEIQSIKAAIGPSIQKSSYEVDLQFYKRFMQQSEGNDHFFGAGYDEDHMQFDLTGYVAKQLFDLGVSHIHISNSDTYAKDKAFFSYRRSTHKGEKEYGRQFSGIMITEAQDL